MSDPDQSRELGPAVPWQPEEKPTGVPLSSFTPLPSTFPPPPAFTPPQTFTPPPASTPPQTFTPPQAFTPPPAFTPAPPGTAPPPGPAYPPAPYPGPVAAPGAGRRTWQLMVGAAAAGALAVALAVFFVIEPGDPGPAGNPATQVAGGEAANAGPGTPLTEEQATTEPATGEPVPQDTLPQDPLAATEEATTDDAALATLEEIYRGDLATVSFNGQLAAQLASKYPGITDSLQVTGSGSNTFRAADILAEHQRLRTANSDAEHPVILLKSTDYGKRRTDNGNFYWMTFAVGEFTDRQAVVDWCENQFAHLGEAERANQCVVARLRPAA